MEKRKGLGPNDFTLRYTSQGGPQPGPGVYERYSMLFVKSRDKVVLFEQHRDPADQPSEPIGRFRTELPADQIAALREQLDASSFQDLSASKGRDMGASLMTFTYARKQRNVVRTINSRDAERLAQIDALLRKLQKIEIVALEHPQAAIRLEIEPVDDGNDDGQRFGLRIINIGTLPLYVGDPRWLPSSGEESTTWAGVKLAVRPERKPGVTARPLNWSRLHLARPEGERPKEIEDIRIDPGGAFVAETQAWRPEKQGIEYLVQGVLINYGGAEMHQEGGHNTYRARGAVFSQRIRVTAR